MPDLRSLSRTLIQGHPVPPLAGLKKLDSCSRRNGDLVLGRYLMDRHYLVIIFHLLIWISFELCHLKLFLIR